MILVATDLDKSFGKRRVVDGVTIVVKEAEVVGLLGPNGAGKTTTFYMIAGIIRPDNGRIFLNGQDVTDLPMFKRARMGLSYLPQEPSIFRKLTVWENITAGLEFKDVGEEERKRIAEEILETFGLVHLKNTVSYVLSGGERRRVEVARAVSLRPKVLLLDEPFTGLDPVTISELRELIRMLRDKFGVSVVITDHNARETLKITDRAYIINNGRIVAEGTPEEIANMEEVRNIYLGSDFEL
ncbi:MAG: LPS export ABC transporter ATP-binding protein [Thermosulfidibacteraceae bacterium]